MKNRKQQKKQHSHTGRVYSELEHPALLHLILIHIVQCPASLYRSLSIRFYIKLGLRRRCQKDYRLSRISFRFKIFIPGHLPVAVPPVNSISIDIQGCSVFDDFDFTVSFCIIAEGKIVGYLFRKIRGKIRHISFFCLLCSQSFQIRTEEFSLIHNRK